MPVEFHLIDIASDEAIATGIVRAASFLTDFELIKTVKVKLTNSDGADHQAELELEASIQPSEASWS